jgi:hypothetical protein
MTHAPPAGESCLPLRIGTVWKHEVGGPAAEDRREGARCACWKAMPPIVAARARRVITRIE